MGRRKNMRSTKKKRRRAAGMEAQRHLAGILESSHAGTILRWLMLLLFTSSKLHSAIDSQFHVRSTIWCAVSAGPLTCSPRPFVCGSEWSTHQNLLEVREHRRFGGGPKYHRVHRRGEDHA